MSSKLEEIKAEMVDLVDKAWHALEGTIDVDKARELAGEVTAALTQKAQDVAEHLFYHVLNNAAPAPSTDSTAAPVEAPTAPDGSTEVGTEPVTGMAPPAGDPAPAETATPTA